MELTGDLSDFALADMLQILALSRRTGTLSLENGAVAGRIIIEGGQITHASVEPGDSLAEFLVKEGIVTAEELEVLRRVGLATGGVWTLESLLQESGLIGRDELSTVARRHIKSSLSRLIGLDKGRFGIALNEARLRSELDDVKLSEGLDVGGVLLEAAKQRDELRHAEQPAAGFPVGGQRKAGAFAESFDLDSRPRSDGFQLREMWGPDGDGRETRGEPGESAGNNGHSALLCSLLTELRSYSFESEVSLSALRYASEVASRGVLFVVEPHELRGSGQFGFIRRPEDKTPDEVVRDLRIPIVADCVLSHVARTGVPYVGGLKDASWDYQFLTKIGGKEGLESFVVPLICKERAIYLLYGDNYPSCKDMRGVDELMTFVSQAGLMLEKMTLERELKEDVTGKN